MRRRSKKLEVSTFPFLAVLLCAMGSLILVLLITDRKGKLAAKFKAQEAYAKLVAAAARDEADKSAARKAQRDAARSAEIERLTHEADAKYQAAKQDLHARLAAQEQEIAARLLALNQNALQAAEKKDLEKTHLLALRHQWEQTRSQVKAEEEALWEPKFGKKMVRHNLRPRNSNWPSGTKSSID